ncbi:hypothetical protein PIB30_043494, partial [Stylosanthes scabra]|nr:hypothetical protein [Stylosanthes scabra]
ILREKKFKQKIERVRIEDGEEITHDKATAAMRRAALYLSALQTSHGHWPAQIAGPLFFLPPLVRVEGMERVDGGRRLAEEQEGDAMVCRCLMKSSLAGYTMKSAVPLVRNRSICHPLYQFPLPLPNSNPKFTPNSFIDKPPPQAPPQPPHSR